VDKLINLVVHYQDNERLKGSGVDDLLATFGDTFLNEKKKKKKKNLAATKRERVRRHTPRSTLVLLLSLLSCFPTIFSFNFFIFL
jgi:hypothetical protein